MITYEYGPYELMAVKEICNRLVDQAQSFTVRQYVDSQNNPTKWVIEVRT